MTCQYDQLTRRRICSCPDLKGLAQNCLFFFFQCFKFNQLETSTILGMVAHGYNSQAGAGQSELHSEFSNKYHFINLCKKGRLISLSPPPRKAAFYQRDRKQDLYLAHWIRGPMQHPPNTWFVDSLPQRTEFPRGFPNEDVSELQHSCSIKEVHKSAWHEGGIQVILVD